VLFSHATHRTPFAWLVIRELGHHPNIVTFFGAVTTGHCMWLVAEFHKMGSIHEFYQRYRRKMASPRAGERLGGDTQKDGAPAIPLELLVKLAADASLGILHLHRENVIHRGIGPPLDLRPTQTISTSISLSLSIVIGWVGGGLVLG
jgi:serine/threonine protein kinase